MAAEPQRDRLPFEPSKKRQKPAKNSKSPPQTAKKAANAAGEQQEKNSALDKQAQNYQKSKNKVSETAKKSDKTAPLKSEAIPKVVSDRMARRIALFCGIPTALGMTTFVASYIVFRYGFKLPNVAVLLVSISFFGLGVLGLSYGVISASWDEEIVGSKLGWQEFATNWGRLRSAWRSARQKNV